MPVARFSYQGSKPRLGKVVDGNIIDLSEVLSGISPDVGAFLAAGESAIQVYRKLEANSVAQFSIDDVELLAPIPKPEKLLAIGMNYQDHGREAQKLGVELPEYQLWFNKQVSCINDPHGDVVLPSVSEKLDYEVELAVVIGKPCRYVEVDAARKVIGGYMVANDVSARDWQMRSSTLTLGKSFDTHGPLGPWVTLDHEVDDPHQLALEMRINGDLRQSATTNAMIHSIYEQIAYLSQVMTLRPGDILETGTPSGVGIAMEPPVFLQPGDVMRAEIDGLGFIENKVVAETG